MGSSDGEFGEIEVEEEAAGERSAERVGFAMLMICIGDGM